MKYSIEQLENAEKKVQSAEKNVANYTEYAEKHPSSEGAQNNVEKFKGILERKKRWLVKVTENQE